jgi:hypothetical protein
LEKHKPHNDNYSMNIFGRVFAIRNQVQALPCTLEQQDLC